MNGQKFKLREGGVLTSFFSVYEWGTPSLLSVTVCVCVFVCLCVCVHSHKVLTKAAVGADICLCLSNGGTNCLSLSVSPISTLCSGPKPHQCINTHTHRHTNTHTHCSCCYSQQHTAAHIPYPSVCTSKVPHPGPAQKKTELQVDVAPLPQGQTRPHSSEWWRRVREQVDDCNHWSVVVTHTDVFRVSPQVAEAAGVSEPTSKDKVN